MVDNYRRYHDYRQDGRPLGNVARVSQPRCPRQWRLVPQNAVERAGKGGRDLAAALTKARKYDVPALEIKAGEAALLQVAPLRADKFAVATLIHKLTAETTAPTPTIGGAA